MKAEINNENKARFFAQYWKQPVLHQYSQGHEITPFDKGYSVSENSITWKGCYLLLTPLSAITDEDAIEWAKIIDPNKIYGDHSNILEFKESFATDLLDPDNLLDGGMSMISLYESLDHLRSKGYALPWMGLSVEEMIEAGWIKLKK